jgi:iron complex outermembrane recepter protein
MKIIAGCLFAIFLVFASNPASAQSASSGLQGKIFAESGGPVEAATIVLLHAPDSAIIRRAVSNKTGVFYFDRLNPGRYLLLVTSINYKKNYSGPFELAPGKSRDIGYVILKPAVNALAGVSVTGRKDYVEVKSDRTVLNIDRNVMAAGASLYEVLSSSPGVKVQNDEILYHGGQKALIAINGKPVLLSGEELTNFLKNYQTSGISKIELIDNPGAKYDAGGSGGGMINIILKKSKELGSNFTLTESAGAGDNYKFNTGVNYNLRTDKLNLYASYNYVNSSIPHSINTSRYISDNGQVDNFDLNYKADVKASNNNFSLGADYALTPRQNLGLLINGFFNDADIDKRNVTYISTNGQRDSSINTISKISRDIHNINYDLNYKAELDKAGRSVLSAEADYSDYQRGSNEMLQNDFYDAAGVAAGNPLFYQDNSPSHITIKAANIDFSQALGKISHLNAGFKESQVNNDSRIDFEQLVNGNYVTVPGLTDHFLYNEHIDAGYLQFTAKNDKSSLSLSLRGEHTSFSSASTNTGRHSDSSYFNLFPNVQLSRQLDGNNLLTLSYSRSINRPNYQDLNPFVSYVDQFYSSTGNPYLQPDYVNTFRASDLFLGKYKASLSMITTDNYFSTIFVQNDATKAYVATKANIGTRYQYMLDLVIPVELTRWWHLDADLEGAHDRFVYKIDSAGSKNTTWASIDLNQDFKITSKLSAEVVGHYETPSFFVISQYKALYWLSSGVTYAVLNNKGSLKMAVSDIFNTNYNRYQTNFANLNMTSVDRIGTRFVTLSFVYHFGNSAARSRSKTTDEQKRLGGSSNEN